MQVKPSKTKKLKRKNRKIGRSARRTPSGVQYLRSYRNKLKRVNRDRTKSGKPALLALTGYDSGGYPL